MSSSTPDLPKDRLWTREHCAQFCGMSKTTFYKKYQTMVREEDAPAPCIGNMRGARWNPQDWFNWAKRRTQPKAVASQDMSGWTPEMQSLFRSI